MKRTLMRNRSLNHTTVFLVALLSLALLAACQQPQQQQANGNANSSNASSNTQTATSGYIDLVGKWEGQAGGNPVTLTITNHMGDTFSGMETVGEYQIRIAGVVDLKTREITIRETDVVKGPAGYALGLGRGVIAPSGRQMSGEWKAKGTSTFSFSK